MKSKILKFGAYIIFALALCGIVRMLWPRVERHTTVEWKEDTAKVSLLNNLLIEAQAKLETKDLVIANEKAQAEENGAAARFYRRLADSLQRAKPGDVVQVPVARLDTLIETQDSIFHPLKPAELMLVATYYDTVKASYTFPPVNRFAIKLGLMPRVYPYTFPEYTAHEIKYETKWENWVGGAASGIVFGYGIGTHDTVAELLGGCGLAFFVILGLFG